MVQWLCTETVTSHPSTCYILTQHDFGVLRLAKNLQTNGLSEFRVILTGEINMAKSVSPQYNWNPDTDIPVDSSTPLEGKLLKYSRLEESLPKLRSMFGAVCVILCTLEVFTKLEKSILTKVLIPPEVVICEDSNQIPIAALYQTLEAYGDTITRLCFVGDDTQRTFWHSHLFKFWNLQLNPDRPPEGGIQHALTHCLRHPTCTEECHYTLYTTCVVQLPLSPVPTNSTCFRSAAFAGLGIYEQCFVWRHCSLCS